jgi:hypothetical protein
MQAVGIRKPEVISSANVAPEVFQIAKIHEFSSKDIGLVKAACCREETLFIGSRKGLATVECKAGRYKDSIMHHIRLPLRTDAACALHAAAPAAHLMLSSCLPANSPCPTCILRLL